MSSIRSIQRAQQRLQREMARLAEQAIFGSLSETYRTCGQAECRCKQGEKHGPHLYISFRGQEGKTTGYYVPQALSAAVRDGVEAWKQFQALARDLAELNRERLWVVPGFPCRGFAGAEEEGWSVASTPSEACSKCCCRTGTSCGIPLCVGSTRFSRMKSSSIRWPTPS